MKTLFVFFLLLAVSGAATRAQTTAFTYQGRLSDGGAAASGVYDLRFDLYDQAAGANPPLNAQPLTFENVTATNGVFTVQLNFAGVANAFTGADRFLEISVRPGAETGALTILAPRQQITSSPYAIQTLRASVAANAEQLGGVAANQFVQTNDSRLSDQRPPAPGSVNYIQNRTTAQPGTTDFNISGSGTLGGTLAASKAEIAGGVLARGGAPGAFGESNNGYAFGTGGDDDGGLFSTAGGRVSLFTNASERLRVNASGNVAIGAVEPTAKLDVRGDIKFGASGDLFALGAAENLRLVRGYIQVSNGAATISNGTGFTVVREAAGIFRITFTASFSGNPVVVPAVINAGNRVSIQVSFQNNSFFQVGVFDPNGNLVDPAFVTFIAVGAR